MYAPKGKLVGFDGYTIHHIHIKEQNQVIKVKNLHIFKDIEIKKNASLPFYKNKPMLQDFLLEDHDNKEGTPLIISPAIPPNKGTQVTLIPASSPRIITSHIRRVIKPTPKTKDIYTITVATSLLSHGG